MNRSIASGVLLLCLGWHLALPLSQLTTVSSSSPVALQTAGTDSGKSVWLPQLTGVGDLLEASRDHRLRGTLQRRATFSRLHLPTPPALRDARPMAHRPAYPMRRFVRLRLIASGDEEAPA